MDNSQPMSSRAAAAAVANRSNGPLQRFSTRNHPSLPVSSHHPNNRTVRLPIPTFFGILQWFTRCKLDECREVSSRWANEIHRSTPFYRGNQIVDHELDREDDAQRVCRTRLHQRHTLKRMEIQASTTFEFEMFWQQSESPNFGDCSINVEPFALSLLGQYIFPELPPKIYVSIEVYDGNNDGAPSLCIRLLNRLSEIDSTQNLLRFFLRINHRAVLNLVDIVDRENPPSSAGFINTNLFDSLRAIIGGGDRFELTANELLVWSPGSTGLGRTIESLFSSPINITWHPNQDFLSLHPTPECSVTGFLETGRAQCRELTSLLLRNLHTHLFKIFTSMHTSYCQVIPIIRVEIPNSSFPVLTPVEFTQIADEERALAVAEDRPYSIIITNRWTKEEFTIAVRETTNNHLRSVVFYFK